MVSERMELLHTAFISTKGVWRCVATATAGDTWKLDGKREFITYPRWKLKKISEQNLIHPYENAPNKNF